MNQEIRFRLALEGAQRVKDGADSVAASLGQVGRSAKQTASDANQLSGIFAASSDGLRQLASIAAGGAIASGFVRAADAVTVLNNQLKLATGSTQAATQAYDALFGIAQRSRTSFTELGATYASIARATSELGISQSRLLTVTEAIGNSLAISGGSAQGMQAALTQLGQGFASGALRGEELNSVLEQTPRLAKAIADGLGVSIGKLRELGKEGKLTADSVLKALESQSAVLAKEVQTSVVTVGQALTQLGNASIKAVGDVDRVTGSSDALAKAFQSAASGVQLLANAIVENESAFKVLLGGIAGVAAVSAVGALGGALATVGTRIAALGATLAANPAVLALLGLGAVGGAAVSAGQAYSKTADGIEGAIATLELANKQSESALERAAAGGRTTGANNINRVITERTEQIRQLRAELDKLRGVDANADYSFLSSAPGGKPASTKPIDDQGSAAKKAAAEFKNLADAGLKLAQAFALEEAGSAPNIVAQWEQLNAARKAGLITLEQQIAAQQRLAQQQPFVQAEIKAAQDLARARADARNAEDKGIQEYLDQQTKARELSLQSAQDSIFKLQEEAAAADLMRGTNLSLAEAIEQVAIARLREQQGRFTEGSEPYLAVEREIEARRQLIGLLGEKSARDAGDRAAKDAADEWERTANDIRSSLTDAFRESFRDGEDFGEAFARNIGAELKARLATAVAEGLSGLVLQGLGLTINGAAGAGGAAGQGNAYLQAAQAANTLYGYGKSAYGYVSGLATTGSTLGASTGAYASLANSQVLAAYGVEGAGAAAGGVTGAAGGAGGAGSGIAVSTWAAAIAAGIYKANQDYSQGFRREQAQQAQSDVLGLDGRFTTEGALANLLDKLGFSDRLTNLLSGSTAVAKIIGRAAPQVQATGLQGTISGGDFTGSAFADILEKGGLFRSDKRSTETSALSEELGRYLDGASRGVLDKAKDYGAALGLPVDALAQLSTDIKVTLTDDAAKNQAAITEALGGYGDLLVASFADAIRPLAGYIDGVAETTAQTLARVGASITGVNQVLDALGLSALKASIDGGRAATELEALFGGLGTLQQAAGSYLQNYYSDAERAALATKGIGDALADFGLQVPASRDAFRDLVDAQDLTTDSGRRAFAALMGVADAFAAVTPGAESATNAVRKRTAADLQAAIDSNIGKFLTPQQATDYQFGAIARDLQFAGLFGGDANLAGTLKGASKDQIFAFASQFVDLASNSTDAKVAIVEAAGALADLKDAAGATADEFAKRISQFTAGLRSSDLSPLSFREQLNSARGLYDRTLTRAQAGDTSAQADLLGNAQAYLQEARSFFGSSADYANAFTRVTTDLDALGAESVDPQVQAIREQVVQLESVRSSVVDLSTTSGNRADTQAELARAQIVELRNVVEAQSGTNAALTAGHRALWDQLADLNVRVQRLLDNAQLSAVSPS
jgi:tape measure domain-containing protein